MTSKKKIQIAPDLEPLAVPIADLKPLLGNPRRGDVEAVMRSYSEFGQRKPIVARKDGTIIAGNHQLEAAKRLGWDKIAVVRVDDDDKKAKAYALADNRVGELGGYDDDALLALLEDVGDSSELLAATGFDENSIDDLRFRLAAPSLDDLAAKYPEEDDLSNAETLSMIRFSVPPELLDRWTAYVETQNGDPVAALTALMKKIS